MNVSSDQDPPPGSLAETFASSPEASVPRRAPAGGPGLPFDPLRLVEAIWRRWWLVALVGGAFAALAGLAGFSRFKNEYRAAAQLLRQEASSTFRASEIGEPFKPRQLSVHTLVSFMKSPAVLQRVGEQAQIPARAVAGGLTITPERNTDIISLSYTSTRSAPVAARVLNAFGTEVVRLTREMQSQEATEMNRLLKRQLSRTEEDLRAVNRDVLDFSRQAGLINVDKEIDAYLRTLGDLDLRFETARIEAETLDLRIAALERELAAHNPLTERVQVAREKLAQLLQQYTTANPLVQEQQTAVAELETRLKEAQSQPVPPPRQGESGLAAGFYSELLNLRTQKEVAAAQLEKLKPVRAAVELKLRGLPEKGMELVRIKARQQSLEASQSLLASRQREAQLYEESTPGYYRFFEARLEEVEVIGRNKKIFLLAAAGGILGAALTLLGLCLLEVSDDRIKTAADLQRATRLRLLASLSDLTKMDLAAQSSWAFRTWLALRSRLSSATRGPLICGFVAASRREGCSTWVDLLARAAHQRQETVVAVTNRAPEGAPGMPLSDALRDPGGALAAGSAITWLIFPADWCWTAERRRQWHAAVRQWTAVEGLVVLMELGDSTHPETLLLAEGVPHLVWLSGSGSARGRDSTERVKTYRDAGCRFAGAVLNRESRLFRRP